MAILLYENWENSMLNRKRTKQRDWVLVTVVAYLLNEGKRKTNGADKEFRGILNDKHPDSSNDDKQSVVCVAPPG